MSNNLDWYTYQLYNLYETKYVEKFFRQSLPEWFGWYNRYNQSFNYEVYDEETETFVKRIIPMRIPNVLEFGFCDAGSNMGMCVYRVEDQLYWFTFMFGTDPNIDDTFIIKPTQYLDITGSSYYLYVHDVKHYWGSIKLLYIFLTQAETKVYVIDTTNPSIVHKIDLTDVPDSVYQYYLNSGDIYSDIDIRLSKTAMETGIPTIAGIHQAHFKATEEESVRGPLPIRIAYIDHEYHEDTNTISFQSNMPFTIWYNNLIHKTGYPVFDSSSQMQATMYDFVGPWASGTDYVVNQVVLDGGNYFSCTQKHISDPITEPDLFASGSPWTEITPISVVSGAVPIIEGHSFSILELPTDSLSYNYVSWKSDVDREWFEGYIQIHVVTITNNGFAYIMFI